MVVRVGVIGGGWMGRQHAEVYAQLPGVDLVGIVEPDRSRREQLAADVGAAAHADADPLLDQVDAVSICTPDHLHVEAASAAMARGLRVLLEKPLATRSSDAEEILAARPDPDALMVGHILRFDPRVIRAREAVEGGAVGELWHVEVWRCTTRAMGADRPTSVGWFLGIHDADLVAHLTGEEPFIDHAIGARTESAHHDVVHALGHLPSGALVSMQNFWTLPAGRTSRAHSGVRLVGAAGAVEVDLGHTDLTVTPHDGASVRRDTYNWPTPTGVHSTSLAAELTAFVTAVASGGPTPVPGEHGLAAVRVVERIHQLLDAGADR